MERKCAGYTIIAAVRVTPVKEIVIGHNPKAPCPYVCWYCLNGDDYHTGDYCTTYRAALLSLADRIRVYSDLIPYEI